ncbi:hypothetical protein ABIE40_000875 [Rhizobium sp. OAE497]
MYFVAISFPFGPACRPRGDQARDAVPVGMHHRQHGKLADLADADVPDFAMVKAPIPDGKDEAIENPAGGVEADTVLFDIQPVLLIVPFKHV